MSKKQVIAFFAVMIAVTGFLIWKAGLLQQYSGVAQIWITVVLALLTAVYVYRTAQMAQEMREERYARATPRCLPRDKNVYQGKSKEFAIYFMNLGTGDAFLKEAWVSDSSRDKVISAWRDKTKQDSVRYVQLRCPGDRVFVPTSGEFFCEFQSDDIPLAGKSVLCVVCSDVYEREFLSGGEFRCELENGRRVIHLEPTTLIQPVERARS
ncbi:MAG: hypothetical protein HYX81_04955 [Chloroflexi bacterium]|nr:hypothetical protein [Chloroflexota bacterium]